MFPAQTLGVAAAEPDAAALTTPDDAGAEPEPALAPDPVVVAGAALPPAAALFTPFAAAVEEGAAAVPVSAWSTMVALDEVGTGRGTVVAELPGALMTA